MRPNIEAATGSFYSQCPLHTRRCRVKMKLGPYVETNTILSDICVRLSVFISESALEHQNFAIETRISQHATTGSQENHVHPFMLLNSSHPQGRSARAMTRTRTTSMSVSYAPLPNTINLPSKMSDQYALHYFFTHAALDLSDNMPDSFWDIVVLQACQRNVVVQQAVIAVGQLHLQHSLDDKSRPTAVLSYHKAIILLRKYPSHNSDPSSIVKLICCILNFTCELLPGSEDASIFSGALRSCGRKHAGRGLRVTLTQFVACCPCYISNTVSRLGSETEQLHQTGTSLGTAE